MTTHADAINLANQEYNNLVSEYTSLIVERNQLAQQVNDLTEMNAALRLELKALQDRIDELEGELGPEILYNVDFSKEMDGPVTASMWVRWFGASGGTNDKYFADRGVKIVNGALRVPLPMNPTDPTFVIVTPLPRALKDVTVTTIQRFDPAIEWKAGGKCGFGVGGTNNTSNPPSGGALPTNGSSCRKTWYSNGRLGAYTYTVMPKSPTENIYGRDEIYPTPVTAGTWYADEVQAVMNTKGNTDGRLIAKLNGGTMIDKPYKWTDVSDFNRLICSIFRGGQGPTYVSSKVSYIEIASVLVTTPKS